jgi:hypothetical protein
LEAVVDNPRSTNFERVTAIDLLVQFKNIRKSIPEEYQDVDLKEKE